MSEWINGNSLPAIELLYENDKAGYFLNLQFTQSKESKQIGSKRPLLIKKLILL